MYQLTNSKIYKLYAAFLNRHDFEDSDLNLLQSKYPDVLFSNIPQAWILPIDNMLEDIYSVDPEIKLSVKQMFGFLIIDEIPHNPDFLHTFKEIINSCEKLIYQLDLDLHNEIGYKFYWIED